ncbi:MAG: cation:proton antiporter [Candidatus Omnitrophota bacterium]|jgi:Kef-type K+ transport system membrane component KefB
MQSILIVGVIIITGFIFGELAVKFRLPKVTGYIIAGVILNPASFHFIPEDFPNHTGLITNISLAFITFSVGGTLLLSGIKKLGKTILYITAWEAELAFIAVAAGFLLISPFFIHISEATWVATFIPISLLLASLASPTDPSATLAVTHQYKAKGDVTSTIMGVSVLDDVLGIVNYSLAVVVAGSLILHKAFSVDSLLLKPAAIIFGGVGLGILFGSIFNKVSYFIRKETEGVFIVATLGLLFLCYGIAQLIGADELLATMAMGAIVVNFNPEREKIFMILERPEELIFVLFFTLSGMSLNFGILAKSAILVVFFFIFRALGKAAGSFIGASISGAEKKVRRYTAGGLIPQGGIVIGLALMIKQQTAFADIADLIISITIGSTVIHELVGPVFAKMALKKAGEIKV